MEFHKLSAREIAAGVREKKFTAEEVARCVIERIKKYDKKYNSIVTLCEERAVAEAKKIDGMVARGEDPGVLAGVPFAVKDNFCTDGIETTCCSKMLKGWVPHYDAAAVKNMKEAGAVLIGKANMDEFAMGSTTESSIFGPHSTRATSRACPAAAPAAARRRSRRGSSPWPSAAIPAAPCASPPPSAACRE